jgi:hypothetical protein
MSSNLGKNELSAHRIKGQHYDKCFIKEIVESIERGVPRSEIVKQHKLIPLFLKYLLFPPLPAIHALL